MGIALLTYLLWFSAADATSVPARIIKREELVHPVKRFDTRKAPRLGRYGFTLFERQGCPNVGDIPCGSSGLCCNYIDQQYCFSTDSGNGYKCCTLELCGSSTPECPAGLNQCSGAPPGICCPQNSQCYLASDLNYSCTSSAVSTSFTTTTTAGNTFATTTTTPSDIVVTTTSSPPTSSTETTETTTEDTTTLTTTSPSFDFVTTTTTAETTITTSSSFGTTTTTAAAETTSPPFEITTTTAETISDPTTTQTSSFSSGSILTTGTTSGGTTSGGRTSGAIPSGTATPGGTTSGGTITGATTSGGTISVATASQTTTSGAPSPEATTSGATIFGETTPGETTSGATTSGAASSGATSSGATRSGATMSKGTTSGGTISEGAASITTIDKLLTTQTTSASSTPSVLVDSNVSHASSPGHTWTAGKIGGIVAGCVVFVILAVLIIIYLVRRCRKSRSDESDHHTSNARWLTEAPQVYIGGATKKKPRRIRRRKADELLQKYLILKDMHEHLSSRESRESHSDSVGPSILEPDAKKALWNSVKRLVVYPTIHKTAIASTAGFANVIVTGTRATDLIDIPNADEAVNKTCSSDLSDADALNNLTDMAFPILDDLPDFEDLSSTEADTLDEDMDRIYAAFRNLHQEEFSSNDEHDELFEYHS